MNSKKLALTLTALAALVAIGAAQTPDRLQKLQERLQLTPDQVEKVRPILTEEVAQLRSVREKYQADQSRRNLRRIGRELKSIQSDTDKKLKPILSKSQMVEWKKIRQEARDARRSTPSRPPSSGRS